MSNMLEVTVPDIGDFSEVEIVDVLVAVGDTVAAEDSLITLETDKAAMDVPSPAAGVIKEMKVALGDKISEGDLVMVLEVDEAAGETKDKPEGEAKSEPKSEPKSKSESKSAAPAAQPKAAASGLPAINEAGFAAAHASPSVRRFARELGVNLPQVKGSGAKSRILKEDVKAFVKAVMQGQLSLSAGSALP